MNNGARPEQRHVRRSPYWLGAALSLLLITQVTIAAILLTNRTASTAQTQESNGLAPYGSSASAAPNFLLDDQSGRPISLTRQRGKAVVLTFVSAACHEDCPLIGHALARVDSMLSAADRRRVVYLGVSVAPPDGSMPSYVAADTPAAINHFITTTGLASAARAGRFLFLIGPRATLAPIWQAYHVAVIVPPAPAPGHPDATTDVGHTALVYLIGPDGVPRDVSGFPFDPEKIAAGLHILLD